MRVRFLHPLTYNLTLFYDIYPNCCRGRTHAASGRVQAPPEVLQGAVPAGGHRGGEAAVQGLGEEREVQERAG